MEDIFFILTIVMPPVITFCFGLWVLLHNPKSRINTSFFAITIALILWSVSVFFLWNYLSLDLKQLKFWLNMEFIGPTVFFSFLVYFSHIFPEDKFRFSWIKIFVISLPILVIVPPALAGKIVTDVISPEGMVFEYGVWFYFFYLFMAVYVFWAFFNFHHAKKKIKKGTEKKAVTIIMYAFVMALFLGVLTSSFLPIVFGDDSYLFLGPGIVGLIFGGFFSYAIIRYDLMEVRVIAKRALFYTLTVLSLAVILNVVVIASRLIEDSYPNLSFWMAPTVFSILAVLLGVYIWKGMRASEDMKHEFVTVVTHKFRTPLSRVVWALDDLKRSDLKEEDKENVRSIETSTKNILELVDMLTTISDEKGTEHNLNQKINISELTKDIIFDHKEEASRKSIHIDINIEEDIFIIAEKSKISFAIKTLIENAVMYTPEGGKVSVSLATLDRKARLEVKDTGIGIDEKTKNLIFSTFFRGEEAKTKYTEGLGVGLYISKRIVDELGGDIGFHSEGEGKGSTFFVELSAVHA